MARLNTRPSILSNASSRYQSGTPQPLPDQENIDPEDTTRRDKIARPAMQRSSVRASLPTPTSANDNSDERPSPGQKRKRAATDQVDEDEEKFKKYFDPDQDPDERREVRRQVRELDRTFRDRRDELLQDQGRELENTVKQADKLYTEVKQTGDATIDSRLLVDVSDLADKKTAALSLDGNSTGIDVDDFLSKVISYMRNQGHVRSSSTTQQPVSTQQRRQARDTMLDDDDDAEDNRPLDWAFLARNACYPHNSRPAVRSFLLGPLSLEKKQRAQTQRRARNTRDANVREAKPTALTSEDLTQADQNSLTAQCTAIRKQLRSHVKHATNNLRAAGMTPETLDTEHGKTLLREARLARVEEKVGAPLLQYVVNPKSFGQTVENLFYVSFLIKEGSAGIGFDEEGLPVLCMSPFALFTDTQQANNLYSHRESTSSRAAAVTEH